MIESFLEDFFTSKITNKRILDIGCGNGQIAHHFLTKENVIYAIDVIDQRTVMDDSIDFQIVADEQLPFDNNTFDIVLSHHVIEHVDNQDKHMSEMSRVVKNSGAIYFGCPNRSSPFMAGHIGNDQVLTLHDMQQLFSKHCLNAKEYYTSLLKYPDKHHCEIKIGKFVPAPLLRSLRNWFPSQYFVLTLKQ